MESSFATLQTIIKCNVKTIKSIFSGLFKPPARDYRIEEGKSLKGDLSELERKISYRFKNPLLLKAALTHSSTSTRNHNGQRRFFEYERMEFFGDAVLGLVTVEYLFNKYRDKAEGELSKLKSNIVSENYLSIRARKIDLGSYISLGEDEFRAKGYAKKSILANMMESLICAIFLDGGLNEARSFIGRVILRNFEKELLSEVHINYKSMLQEYFQSKYQRLPEYKLISAEGPDHKKIFSVVVCFDNEQIGSGSGTTKKSAEQNAAREAYTKLGL